MKNRPVAVVGLNLALAGLYYLAGRLGLHFAFGHASVTTIWPPTGIALAAVLLFGPRLGPGIFIGALLVNLTAPGSVLTAGGIAVGNTLEALVGACAIRRFAGIGRGLFDRVQTAFLYIFIGAVGAPILSATIGVATLALTGYGGQSSLFTLWRTWWLGDAVGALVVAPFLLIWREPVLFSWKFPRVVEALALLGSLFIIGQMVFDSMQPWPVAYITLPLLVWAATRFHQHGAAAAVLILSVIALRGTVERRGAFAVDDPALSLFILQGFVGTIATTSLVVAALVSERGRAEESLRLVTDALPALISYIDRDERYVFNNRAYEQWFGRSRAEIQGKTLREVLGGEPYERIRPHLERVFKGERVEYESELEYKGIGTRWIHADYVPDLGPDGKPRGFFALIVDRTDRKRAEEALARWNHIFNHAGWAVAVLRPDDGVLDEVNPGFARMHGYPVEELIGRPLIDLISPESRGDLPRRTSEGEAVYESTHIRKDGSTFRALTHASAFRDQDGRVLYRAAVFQDITDLKRAEASIRELNAALERRVEERTSELQEALKELESFSYSIAHDLRAPLRAMTGISELLADEFRGQLGATGADYTRRIADGARRMDTLIQNLLDFGRLTREELPMETVNVEALLLELLATMAPEIEERRAQVEVEGPFPDLLVHRITFVQVLTNLISNGIKFVKPGVDPRMRIRAERRDKYVRIWFEDNGIGIDPQYHDRIFGVFQRLHTGSEYPGTGIGLAIVKKAIERMGGRVGVESAPGKGSRFWIELSEVRGDSALRSKVHRSLGKGRS